jgi:amino acid transporter
MTSAPPGGQSPNSETISAAVFLAISACFPLLGFLGIISLVQALRKRRTSNDPRATRAAIGMSIAAIGIGVLLTALVALVALVFVSLATSCTSSGQSC